MDADNAGPGLSRPAGATTPPCVMLVNANDPSGAGGLTADIATIVSVGGHAVAVACGTYVRDTHQNRDFYSLEADAVTDQARAVLEDLPIQAIKIGFMGSPGQIAELASIAADYPDLPVVAYMPDLAWWDKEQIEAYLDAFSELLLPETTVLVGNHSTLSRWLLPDWDRDVPPGPREIAAAAAQAGALYTLTTGIPLPDQRVSNVLASPASVIHSQSIELFDATFSGAGETLSAALVALLAHGYELPQACAEALEYLDQCLEAGFRPGMGHVIPDRMFWAEPEELDAAPEETSIGSAVVIAANQDSGEPLECLVLPTVPPANHDT